MTQRHPGSRGRGHGRRRGRVAAAAVASSCLVLGALAQAGSPAGAHSRPHHHHDAFQQVNLVSDIPGLAQKTEPALINPWGIAFSDTSPLWVNNQGALPGEPSKIQLYRGANGVQEDIEKLELEVDASSPTGMVFNDSEKFLIDQGQGPVPARFIFNEVFFGDPGPTSRITGWAGADPNPTVTTPASAPKTPAFHAGMALVPATALRGPRLLVANFKFPDGRIDVYNGTFQEVTKRGQFVDRRAEEAGLAPYNVAYLDGLVYVAYSNPFVADAVSVFTPEGTFLKRLVTDGARGRLVGPWGMAIAPDHWGHFGGDLLVANVDDGRIHAFNPDDGDFEGTLRDARGAPLVNLGIWGIAFGNGTIGTPRTLLFVAGMGDEVGSFEGFYEHGLLGLIKPVRDRHGDDDEVD